jgi:hypothetical protein
MTATMHCFGRIGLRSTQILALLAAGCVGVVGGPADGGAAVDGGVIDSGSGDSGTTPNDAGYGDTYLPWEGGAAYYGKWTNGPSSNPNYFPIAVWLQSASNAPGYRAIGVNTYIGLSQGTTNAELAALKTDGMQTICDPDGDWQTHLADPTIDGWRIPQDEPDNAQPADGGGYGPCIDPSAIVAEYDSQIAADPTRPEFLNLGQGVAYVDYPGRGCACAGMTDMYPQYAAGADILSFDIYPVNNTDPTTGGNLWYVATGVDNLRQWASFKKPVWNWIETTGFNDPSHTPTPAQIKTEVWMSIIHGSLGIGYFCHIFSPCFIEAGLLSIPANSAAVKAIDAQIESLAPVLNTPSLANGATVSSSDSMVPVDIMVKRYQGQFYVLAVAMRPGSTMATFSLRAVGSATATVLGESRTIPVSGGNFTDSFASYDVHLYQIVP